MKTLNLFTALTLVAALALLPGCGDTKAPEDIPRAVTNTDAPAVPAEPAEAPMEAVPDAPVETPDPAEAPVAAAEPTTYILEANDESLIGFTGYKVTGNQQGGWSEFAGTVELPEGTIESGKINIVIQMASLFSGNSILTETLHDESWFNIAGFPEATFTSSKIEKTDEGYKVTGDLTMRGITKNISFPAQIAIEGDQLKTQAKFALNRSEWGIKSEGFAGDLVQDEVVVEFDVVANKS